MKVAIIDIGTNTFHLLIAQNGEVEIKQQIPVKLAEGMVNDIIAESAIARALKALKTFSEIVKDKGVVQVKAIATSGLRNAKNSALIISRAREETGIDIITIDGKKEAELIFKGVGTNWPAHAKSALVMDIGGGSVEFMIGSPDNLRWRESFECGAGRMLNRYQPGDPIKPEETAHILDELNVLLSPVWEVFDSYKPSAFIGSAGSFMSLATMAGLIGADDEDEVTRPEDFIISVEKFEQLYERILRSSLQERLLINGLAGYRAEMMVMAMLLVKSVLLRTSFSEIHVSPFALKEGILAEMMN